MSLSNVEFIWPISFGLKEDEPGNLISYHIGKNGVFCKKNIFGKYYVIHKDENLPDLEEIKEDLHPIKDNKIPSYLFELSLGFFKYVNDHFDRWLEAMVVFGITKDDEYFAYVPPQKVTHASVEANLEQFYIDNPGCFIVADIHSHSDFGAFWSGVDTSDDIKGRYSIVSGYNQRIMPEVKCRFNYSGKYVDMEIDDIFENNDNLVDIEYDFDEWVTQLEESATTIIPYNHNRNNHYSGHGYGYGYGGMYAESSWERHMNILSGDDDPFGCIPGYPEHNKSYDFTKKHKGKTVKCEHCEEQASIDDVYEVEKEFYCKRCLLELGLI